jgi:hypothetical protein
MLWGTAMRYDMIKERKDEQFRRLTGVKRATFDQMANYLRQAKARQKAKGGKPNGLSIEDQVLMMLSYWREYRTYFHVGQTYGLSEKPNLSHYQMVRRYAEKQQTFQSSGPQSRLFQYARLWSRADRCDRNAHRAPQKRQRRYYSGKKKRHTLKTQIAVDKGSGKILAIAHGKGRRHDFHLFKASKLRLHPKTKAVVDSGFQGLQKLHAETEMPKKRSKKNPLTKDDKARNREISAKRVLNENVIAVLKRFKIIAERYRNRRKRFGLRFFLIAAIYNFELQTAWGLCKRSIEGVTMNRMGRHRISIKLGNLSF